MLSSCLTYSVLSYEVATIISAILQTGNLWRDKLTCLRFQNQLLAELYLNLLNLDPEPVLLTTTVLLQ